MLLIIVLVNLLLGDSFLIGVDIKYKDLVKDLIYEMKSANNNFNIEPVYNTKELLILSQKQSKDLSFIISDRDFLAVQNIDMVSLSRLGNILLATANTSKDGVVSITIANGKPHNKELGLIVFKLCSLNASCTDFLNLLKNDNTKKIFQKYGF
ncbi:hypothetical protein [Campylobacter iguaniorum]|uniref:hypothetical protein n=1 Tax=Campylobacter iguaniorum TaxID=1244531 RepID=UPI000A3E13FB|nr:hypothetical protein [Campylobacter iguaniorum]